MFSPVFTTKARRHGGEFAYSSSFLRVCLSFCLCVLGVQSLRGQVESVETSAPAQYIWVSHGRAEGHLASEYSPAGAFSPDSSLLAVVNEDKVVLMGLREASVQRVLRPRLPDIIDLGIQSASFLAMNQLFLLATGLVHAKGKGPAGSTPLLAFQWNAVEDTLSGKVNAVGPGGGFGRARYFPDLGYLGLYKNGDFDLWNPRDGRGARVTIAALTQQPHLYTFSPDGHWLLLARIEMSSSPDPIVVRLSAHKFEDVLRGHQGTVLGIAFSRDSKKVVTACEDGKVRIFSVPDWKLLQTLTGHQGPVHWAEFSADGNWVASAGEDRTVRIWSAENGQLAQTLEDMQAPVLSVAFSPNGEYVAATSEQVAQVWRRTRTN